MRNRWLLWLALPALILALGAAPLRAEEDGAESKVEPLSMRLYPVFALTRGRTPFGSQFQPTQKPATVLQDRRRARLEDPEPLYPLGMADELIELIKSHVLPAYWEQTEGADIRTLGEGGLVVRCAAGVHAEVARYLAGLERSLLRTVSVDVQAVRLSAKHLAELLDEGTGARLEHAKVRSILVSHAAGPGVHLTTENRMQAESFGGAQRAFLRRHEVVAYEGSSVTVPVAGVTNPGFAVSVRPMIHAEDAAVRLRLDATLSEAQERESIRSAENHLVELPATPLLDVHVDLVLTPGFWSLAHGVAGGWSLLVRATPGSASGFGRRAASISLDAPYEARPGPMEIRDFDVGSLAGAMQEIYGEGAFLYDTSWDGPAPAHTPEPHPVLSTESLVELVRESIGGEAAWEDPSTIEARNGMLIVRNTKPMLAALDGWLANLRRNFPTVVTTAVEIVDVSPLLARRLLDPATKGGSVWLLDEAGRALIDEALEANEALRLEGGRVNVVDGWRNTFVNGRRFEYVCAYEAEKGSGTLGVRPRTATCLSGLELDLRATATPGRAAADLVVRCMRTHLAPAVRRVETVHGEIELPELRTLRVRTNLSVPLGRTAIVGGAPGESGRRSLLLLTPRLQSRTR